MAIGAFPGMMAGKRRTIKAPINEMDKSTVVSIYPRAIREVKVTIQPGVFEVNAGSYDNPSILVVGASSWWREISEEEPLLEIPNGSVQVAAAIVRDFCIGLVACNMSNSMPGLFWLPGEHTVKDIQTNFKNKLDAAQQRQNTYYTALVVMADTLWARTNGNPLSITSDMRIAAKYLNLDMKDWMSDFKMAEKVECPACGTPIKPNVFICSNCRAIVNEEKAKASGIKFAM